MPIENSSSSSTPTTPFSLSQEEYHIASIDVSDHETIIDFLRRFFFRDEPLNVSVKLLDQENPTCPELEEYSIKTIKDGLSVMAATSYGQIIGVCLNGVIRRGDVEEEKEDVEEKDGCPNKKFCKIIKFLKHVEKESNVFGRYLDFDKILCVKILSVDGSWRGRGIAKELMDKTREIARREGFRLMRADCTSYYSAKALARLGFECIYGLKYTDYKEDGEVVFNTDSPHNEIKIYVQEI